MNLKIHDKSGDKNYFTIIPNYILNHSTLWDREVYIQMKRITGEDGTCWTSQKTLSKQCGMSINRLKKSLQYLLDHKWIRQLGKKEVLTRGGVQEVNEYEVTDLWKMNVEYYEKGASPHDTPIAKGVSPNEQRGVTAEAKGVSPGDDKEEPIQEEPIKEEQAPVGAGFSFQEEIQKLEDSPRRDLNIIALYLEKRKPDIRSKEQLSVAIRRHLRAAKELVSFEDSQILSGFDKARRQTAEWTIETSIKMLTK